MNQQAFADAKIVVAERNFACGSSRENAVTVMLDNGLRAFIAPELRRHLLQQLLPERRPADPARRRPGWRRSAPRCVPTPGAKITIDLAKQTVTGPDGKTDRFEIDSFRKECLLKGVDEVNLTSATRPTSRASRNASAWRCPGCRQAFFPRQHYGMDTSQAPPCALRGEEANSKC